MPLYGDEKREYQRKWKAARRAKWFEGKSCVVCEVTDDLHLDHIDPTTKVDHKIWSWSWARIEEETAKCQVLCKEHHEEKTLAVDIPARLGPIYQHGTNAMYSSHGCRCVECRAWNAARMRRQRSA